MTHRARICGLPINIRITGLDGRPVDGTVPCTKAIGHHCWAGKKRDPIHSHRVEADHGNPTLQGL